ncbi:hypothetical protein CBS63078_2146 [Aspergillus niger]|nr:hypothetical protein CBS115989_7528 [Aspergillus niger]KAI2831001.1 hypothetical protein CBS133816_2837 [Aspergillus niger]KAI2842602.1 hypothetical protein CBS11232_8513 [Aspergillus niger]KAI2852936.1 hypothetical protein CBS11350_569 [Aspergillus niger]KAI2873953.1 hypothetical protein CBS115988_6575 [Aspergillus niger]
MNWQTVCYDLLPTAPTKSTMNFYWDNLSPPTSHNDETTQNKDKHMSKLASPTGTTIVMTDQSTCFISSFIASQQLATLYVKLIF